LPNPRIGPWIRLLKNIAQAHSLIPEFEVPYSFLMFLILI
jgi:D-aminoacyl-tRNA deacylase